jgi:hypothetical protein
MQYSRSKLRISPALTDTRGSVTCAKVPKVPVLSWVELNLSLVTFTVPLTTAIPTEKRNSTLLLPPLPLSPHFLPLGKNFHAIPCFSLPVTRVPWHLPSIHPLHFLTWRKCQTCHKCSNYHPFAHNAMFFLDTLGSFAQVTDPLTDTLRGS